jgi:hypothetical protein
MKSFSRITMLKENHIYPDLAQTYPCTKYRPGYDRGAIRVRTMFSPKTYRPIPAG